MALSARKINPLFQYLPSDFRKIGCVSFINQFKKKLRWLASTASFPFSQNASQKLYKRISALEVLLELPQGRAEILKILCWHFGRSKHHKFALNLIDLQACLQRDGQLEIQLIILLLQTEHFLGTSATNKTFIILQIIHQQCKAKVVAIQN